jgi:hypothetical protein
MKWIRFLSDLKFLKEFIAASGGTMAGFLARWLMCESVVDIQSCELFMPDEELCVGETSLVSGFI